MMASGLKVMKLLFAHGHNYISSYLWTSNPQKTRWHPTWNSHWMKFACASTCASNIVLQKKISRVHAALTFTLSYFGLKHIESTQATCHLTVPAPFLTVPAPFLTVPALSSRFTHGSSSVNVLWYFLIQTNSNASQSKICILLVQECFVFVGMCLCSYIPALGCALLAHMLVGVSVAVA